ncbi:protein DETOXIFICATION 16-like [Actinidia eriantha]|uniref:protein DETOXIFICATION 16-like n=1 Tax=Actinidia eriantha TaxID=165200 RepID=UPI00258FBBF4|nr:protein DETOXIFICATION 16-like [Actinidia eriantha]
MDKEISKPDLKSPLIPIPENGTGNSGKPNNESRSDSSEISAELSKQVQLAGPLVVVSLLQYSLQMISLMFIGHLGELSLSSASMASSFAGVTGFSFMLGMGSALETFCGQAYGAKQYYMLGIHMQRAMLVLMAMGIPIALIWFSTAKIFILCGQDLEISTQAGIYARWLIPSVFPYGLLQCQLRFLQTQNHVKPLLASTSIASFVHALVCWVLVFRLGMGSRGAALSIAISYWLNVVILAIYIKFSPLCRKTWTGFSKDGMKDLVGFLSLGVPSALMVCLEHWSYEALVLMSGLLPNPQLETSMMSVSLNTSSLIFRIPYGFGSAVSTRVSNELGAGKPKAARLAVQVVVVLAIAEGLLLSLILVATRGVWGYLFTNEDEVVKYIAAIMPVLAVSNFMDGIQGVLSGAARGCGWQKIGAYVNLGAYYLVGLPSAIILTFVFHFGGKGLWIGIIGGSSLQGLLLLAFTMRTDWELQARKARDRVNASSIPTDMAAA